MRLLRWAVYCLAGLVAGGAVAAQDLSTLWQHVYNQYRLQVHQARATVTGTIADPTHGKSKIPCRAEKDGDLHCWLTPDAGQELLTAAWRSCT